MRNSSSGHPAFPLLSRLPRSQSLRAANYIHGNWIDEELSKAGIGFLEKKGSKRWGSVLASLSLLASVAFHLSFSWGYRGQSSIESEGCCALLILKGRAFGYFEGCVSVRSTLMWQKNILVLLDLDLCAVLCNVLWKHQNAIKTVKAAIQNFFIKN